MLQALLIKTAIEAARRAFWKNGNKAVPAVVDVLSVKHETADPQINDQLARALAWLYRGIVIIALVKLAQLAGFDVTPYLHLILQEVAAETSNAVTG